METLKAFDPTARFYSLNRAWSPGMARLGAAVWSGDVNPSWNDLRATPSFILNYALAGSPYVACDIGGFTGQTTGPLLTRWMQVGAFMPIMRVHSTNTATPHFPFLWPEPYQSAMRSALNLRYRLIPFHYSLAHAMYSTGKMWMRPLAMEFPIDASVSTLTDQWLDGTLLVSPVLTEDSRMKVYLPIGTWYRFGEPTSVVHHAEQGPITLDEPANITDMPAFAPSGAIIPLAPRIQYSDALPGGPLEVQVFAGSNGTFLLVEDDGETTAYQSGQKRSTEFKWHDQASTLTWNVTEDSFAVNAHPSWFTDLTLTLYSESGVAKSQVVTFGAGGKIAI